MPRMTADLWRFRLARSDVRERLLIGLMFRLPDAFKDRLLVHRIGELTAIKSSLHEIEVPEITVQDIMSALDEPDA